MSFFFSAAWRNESWAERIHSSTEEKKKRKSVKENINECLLNKQVLCHRLDGPSLVLQTRVEISPFSQNSKKKKKKQEQKFFSNTQILLYSVSDRA